MGPGLAEAEHRLPSAASLICIYKPGVKGKESQIILPHLTNFVEYIKFYKKKKILHLSLLQYTLYTCWFLLNNKLN